MFNEKEKDPNRIETLIGDHCNILGDLTGNGVLKVDGRVDGDIIWQDDVILGISSYCKGNISCKNAFVSGMVEGNIVCENSLYIENFGKVMGGITVKHLAIREGGLLDGKCTMIVTKSALEVLG